MTLDWARVLADVDEVLAVYAEMRRTAKYPDCSDLGDVKVTQAVTAMAAAIDRCAPPGSRYAVSAQKFIEQYGPGSAVILADLAGVLGALRADIAAGRMKALAELIHGELFGDLLDMSAHLLEEGYKDAAAVMVGGVLEGHLRKLCDKSGLPRNAGGRTKKASLLNDELATADAYSKMDQKNVTAWLGLRNHAAHGEYDKYTLEQVKLLQQSVADWSSPGFPDRSPLRGRGCPDAPYTTAIPAGVP